VITKEGQGSWVERKRRGNGDSGGEREHGSNDRFIGDVDLVFDQ